MAFKTVTLILIKALSLLASAIEPNNMTIRAEIRCGAGTDLDTTYITTMESIFSAINTNIACIMPNIL
ncbi:hypothetical protein RLOatenuis_2730 [Rickettsiales bacterium]|nr:hypothetical protein RLOatenuis_2730 [Rickettsiales bacterium]